MAANLDTTAHLRYMATVRRQSAPPRCHPFLIVVLVSTLMCTYTYYTYTHILHILAHKKYLYV